LLRAISSGTRRRLRQVDPDDDEAYPAFANDADPWEAHFAEIDALLDRTDKVLAGETPLPKSRSHLVYDPDVDDYASSADMDDAASRAEDREFGRDPWS